MGILQDSVAYKPLWVELIFGFTNVKIIIVGLNILMSSLHTLFCSIFLKEL